MWIVAFLGASSAFIESTLAQIYKERDGKDNTGVARRTTSKGPRPTLVCSAVRIGDGAGGRDAGRHAVNAITSAVNEAWDVPVMTTTAVLLVVLGAILIGGVRRIARVAEWVVPLMAVAYLLVAALVMVLNADRVPEVIMLVLQCIRRGCGVRRDDRHRHPVGRAPWRAVQRGRHGQWCASGRRREVSHPVKQGLVQSFSVYIDTMVVCSATAFLILSTGLYNVYDPAVNSIPDEARLLLGNLPGIEAGPRFVQHAVESTLPGFGRSFVALAILPFAFTTILALYYMAETNVSYLCRDRPTPWVMGGFQLLFLAATGYSAVNSATVAWSLGDIGVGLMSWLNIIAILLLQRPALAALRDYEAQKRKQRDPLFKPQTIGVSNTRVWES